MSHDYLEKWCKRKGMLSQLEILVLSNVEIFYEESDATMNLGIDTVSLFLGHCPGLIGIGDLGTWRGIDYFDPDSDGFYNSTESEFSLLQREAVQKNWNLDLSLIHI